MSSARLLRAAALVAALAPAQALAQGQPVYPPPPTYAPPPGQPVYAPPPGQPVYAPPSAAAPLTLNVNDPRVTLDRLAGQMAVSGWSYGGGYMVGTLQQWNTVCTAPCGVPVEPGQVYSIRGLGVRPSAPFVLPAGVGALDVRLGSRGLTTGGAVLTSFGSGFLAVGLIVMIAGATVWDPATDFTYYNTRRNWITAGAIMSVAGAGMLAGGIVMLLRGRTLVRLPDGQRLALSVPLGRGLALTPGGLAF